MWLVMAAAMLIIATGLTLWVTNVNGHVPLAADPTPDMGPPLATFKNGKLEIDRAVFEKLKADNKEAQKHPDRQTVAVYARQADEDLARRIGIDYSSDHPGGHARIAFRVPEGAEVKFVLNNVIADSCKALGTGTLTAGNFPVTVHEYGGDFTPTRYLIDPGRPGMSFTLSCNLMNIFRRHTFTQRTAAFGFNDAGPSFGDAFAQPGQANWLQGFSLLPSASLNFSEIDGADQFQFLGGHQDQSMSDFEFRRVLTPGQSVRLTWVDATLEQLRDILLVVIGTVVGLGVTMFIKAIRPWIDGLDELAEEDAPIVADLEGG